MGQCTSHPVNEIQSPLLAGLLCISTLVTSGANGVELKSKTPKMAVWDDNK